MRRFQIMAMIVATAPGVGARDTAGQAVPEPELYLPGIVSTADYDLNAAFSPDGGTLLFTRSSFGHWWMTVFITERTGSNWSTPQVASFSGLYSDADAIYHPDGTAVFFISDRPIEPGGEAADFNIWRVPAVPGGFGEPVPLPAPVNGPGNDYFPSLTRDGVLYFSAARRGSDWGYDLYRAELTSSGYAEPELLPETVNGAGSEIDVVVDPAERFMIFAAYGREDGLGSGDLYVSFHSDSDGWQTAMNLDAPVNSAAREYAPGLSPDGEHLFFTTERPSVAKGEVSLGRDEWARLMHEPGNGAGDVYRIRLRDLRAFRDAAAGLLEGREMDDRAAVRAVAQTYLDGILASDTAMLARAFAPEAQFFGVPDDSLRIWHVQDWIRSRAGRRLQPVSDYIHRVVSVAVAGNAASAEVELLWPRTRFVDYLSLLRMDGEWKIVNKIWHEEPRPHRR